MMDGDKDDGILCRVHGRIGEYKFDAVLHCSTKDVNNHARFIDRFHTNVCRWFVFVSFFSILENAAYIASTAIKYLTLLCYKNS